MRLAADELRPSEAVMRGGCACIVDAMGRAHPHRAHILDLVTPTPDRVLFGRAATISYVPVRSDLKDEKLHNFARLFYEAVGDDALGRVLVLASNGHPDVSMGGGTKLSRLQNLQLAGLLTDARIRDFRDLARYDFAVYCKGETTRWGGDVLMPFEANVPVVLERVTVLPGDYVLADASGAVIIPSASIREVLEEAEAIAAADEDAIRKIRKEDPETVKREGSGEA